MGNNQPTIFSPEAPSLEPMSLRETSRGDNIFSSRKGNFSYKYYKDFLDAMNAFTSILSKKIPANFPILPIKTRVLNSYFSLLDNDLNRAKIFDITMSVYNRIRAIYGNSGPYPQQELEKISFPLIAKYIAYNYDVNEEDYVKISDKIIKRTNFLTEEFPLKLNHIISIIKLKCGCVYGYDNDLNLNFYIEHFNSGDKNTISYIDYVIYIMFIIEIVVPCLEKNKVKLGEKINIIVNFNGNEPNTELITFIMTYLNNFYPLKINKMHIIKYNIQKLKENVTFKDSLNKIDYFKVLLFHSNKTYVEQLCKQIDVNKLPTNVGGNGKIEWFVPEDGIEEKELFEEFAKNLIKNIFCLENEGEYGEYDGDDCDEGVLIYEGPKDNVMITKNEI